MLPTAHHGYKRAESPEDILHPSSANNAGTLLATGKQGQLKTHQDVDFHA